MRGKLYCHAGDHKLKNNVTRDPNKVNNYGSDQENLKGLMMLKKNRWILKIN